MKAFLFNISTLDYDCREGFLGPLILLNTLKNNKIHYSHLKPLKVIYVMRCAIWYHLYNLKNVKKNPWRSVTFSNVKLLGFSLQL